MASGGDSPPASPAVVPVNDALAKRRAKVEVEDSIFDGFGHLDQPRSLDSPTAAAGPEDTEAHPSDRRDEPVESKATCHEKETGQCEPGSDVEADRRSQGSLEEGHSESEYSEEEGDGASEDEYSDDYSDKYSEESAADAKDGASEYSEEGESDDEPVKSKATRNEKETGHCEEGSDVEEDRRSQGSSEEDYSRSEYSEEEGDGASEYSEEGEEDGGHLAQPRSSDSPKASAGPEDTEAHPSDRRDEPVESKATRNEKETGHCEEGSDVEEDRRSQGSSEEDYSRSEYSEEEGDGASEYSEEGEEDGGHLDQPRRSDSPKASAGPEDTEAHPSDRRDEPVESKATRNEKETGHCEEGSDVEADRDPSKEDSPRAQHPVDEGDGASESAEGEEDEYSEYSDKDSEEFASLASASDVEGSEADADAEAGARVG